MAESELPASALVDAIDDALLVVDEDDDVVECNEAFETIIPADGSCTGPLESVLAEHPTLRDRIEDRDESIVAVETDGRTRYYQLSTSSLETGTDRGLELVVLHDVTSQQEYQRTLERENEQLDQFAAFISHDLRNPLDVAIGRTTVIRELVEDSEIATHLDEIERSHSRMLRIIEDVLTLARQGQSIDEKTNVDLGALAADAWSHVETNGGTLAVETEQTVLADPARLEQIFENLYRNSLDHGSSDDTDQITITVGALADEGFYVADDGVGIDPELRDNVLEPGFSEHDGGTGLGLSIVSNIAEAHQWDVTVTESETGGARFEFTDVEAVSE